MGLSISRQHCDQLLQWARDATEEECCGLILGQDGHVEKLVLAQNVALRPTSHFEIDPATLIAAEKAARIGRSAVLGYFHSHPNGMTEPSTADADVAAADERIWLIVTLRNITGWRAVPKGALHGRFDPVELVIQAHAQG